MPNSTDYELNCHWTGRDWDFFLPIPRIVDLRSIPVEFAFLSLFFPFCGIVYFFLYLCFPSFDFWSFFYDCYHFLCSCVVFISVSLLSVIVSSAMAFDDRFAAGSIAPSFQYLFMFIIMIFSIFFDSFVWTSFIPSHFPVAEGMGWAGREEGVPCASCRRHSSPPPPTPPPSYWNGKCRRWLILPWWWSD